MEWVETTGKSVEEAEEAALDQLGIDRDDAEFELLEEPRAGLFGRVRGEARVRARVAPRTPRPKQERRSRRKGRSNNGRSNANGRNNANNANNRDTAQQRGDAPAGDGGKPRGPRRADASPKASTDVQDDHATAEPDAAVDQGQRPRGERSRNDRRTPRPDDDRPVLTVAQEGELVSDFLDGLVDAFDLDAEVVTTPVDDDTVQIDVNGDGLGILVGPRGHTLSAVQELSRTILQRKAGGGFQGRVRVDVGGYRAKRREALARFATGVADDVIASGKASALEPMSPPDRKVVHDTINEIDGVATRSEGDEPRRYVVIAPAD